ncbi:MAG: hypothetical protein K2P99_01735 [Burkholderiales bacterium]|nr:hypothetical protein [Burkholderiales bacterium]
MKKLYIMLLLFVGANVYATNNSHISISTNSIVKGTEYNVKVNESTLELSFGKPTYILTKTWQKLNNIKSNSYFSYSIMYFYSNGVFKIVAPKYERYGTYYLQGNFSANKFTIYAIVLPAIDVANTTSCDIVNFDNINHTFSFNSVLNHTDEKMKVRDGTFTLTTNDIINPVPIKWNYEKYLAYSSKK